MRISARFRDIRPISSDAVWTVQSRIALQCRNEMSTISYPLSKKRRDVDQDISSRKQQQEKPADYRLFAIVSCNLGGSYNPRARTGTSGRFADVSSVGTAIIVSLHAEGTSIGNSGSHLSPGTCYCLEWHMQRGENNAAKDAKEPRPGPSLICLLRHADAGRSGKAD